MSSEKSRLVYSTDQPVPRQNKPAERFPDADVRPAQQKVTLRLDRKGRGGKSVTVIEGIQFPQKEKEQFLRQLKARLGTGGTVRDNAIEIQGDYRDALMTVLEKMGYRPKRSGG